MYKLCIIWEGHRKSGGHGKVQTGSEITKDGENGYTLTKEEIELMIRTLERGDRADGGPGCAETL